MKLQFDPNQEYQTQAVNAITGIFEGQPLDEGNMSFHIDEQDKLKLISGIGNNLIIDDDCTLDAKGETNQGITLGDLVTIGRFSSIVCKDADITIGSHVNIGTNVKIIAANQGKIKIGNSIDIGSGCHFSGGSYDYSDVNHLPSTRRIETKGIILEDLAWVGSGVIILDGVTIGSKSIVGAGAVVTNDIPANSLVAGVPAEVKKFRS